MPDTQKRITDYQLIADTAANKEGIANLKEDVAEIKSDVADVKDDVAEIKAMIAAQNNRLIGASWLAKFLWLGFPTISAVFTYVAMRKAGA